MKPGDRKAFSTEDLLGAAHEARAKAYAPYSNFQVGAAVDVGDGVIFSGANIENASYNVGLCAERVAVSAAAAAGYRRILAVAVAGAPDVTCAPCGACRQFIVEFGADVRVTYTTPDGSKTAAVSELLPDFFGPHQLGK